MLHKDHIYVVQGYMSYICPIKFKNIYMLFKEIDKLFKKTFLCLDSILSCLLSECVTPCLHDLLEFRRAELVPWFADLLAFFLISFFFFFLDLARYGRLIVTW